MVADGIPLILAEFQSTVLSCKVSRTLTVPLVPPVAIYVTEVMEETADDETVLRDATRCHAGYIQGLECMVCHATGVLVVAVTLDSEEVAALKEVDYILYALSSGRTEEVDDLGLCVHCLTVHSWEFKFVTLIIRGSLLDVIWWPVANWASLQP